MGGSACEDAGRSDIIFHSVDLAGCAFSVEVPPDLLSEKILLEEGRVGRVFVMFSYCTSLLISLLGPSYIQPVPDTWVPPSSSGWSLVDILALEMD